ALVVTTPDPAAIEDAEKTAEMARATGTEVIGWIVNRSATVPDAVARTAGSAPAVPVPPSENPPLDARDAYDRALTEWVNA
ncbi:MAG: hypothetical protein ACOCSN_07375, partial [Halanaeroarchaeum sp.]